MTVETIGEALRILGADGVRAAVAAEMKACHPDTAESPDVNTVERIAALKEARDCLLSFLETAPAVPRNPCMSCRGRGSVPGRFGATICTTCNGTGEKQ